MKIGKYQLILAPEQSFGAIDQLTFYVGTESASVDASGNPQLRGDVTVRSGARVVQTIPIEAASPAPSSKRYFLLKQFKIALLPAGEYELRVAVQDLGTNSEVIETTHFAVH